MKLFLPKNIFSSIFISVIENPEIEIINKESAVLSRQLESDTSAIALIPSLELINNRNLFVSQALGFSFDGVLSNAYLSFTGRDNNISKLTFRGDVSINEILLSKILFSERYSTELEISLDPAKEKSTGKDYIIVGDENFYNNEFSKSISFADQIAELIDLPYVNYLFVSKDKEALARFNSLFANIDSKIEDNISATLSKLSYGQQVNNFFIENFGSVYYEITENEINALNELVKLVYYHGIIEDIFDLKLV